MTQSIGDLQFEKRIPICSASGSVLISFVICYIFSRVWISSEGVLSIRIAIRKRLRRLFAEVEILEDVYFLDQNC